MAFSDNEMNSVAATAFAEMGFEGEDALKGVLSSIFNRVGQETGEFRGKSTNQVVSEGFFSTRDLIQGQSNPNKKFKRALEILEGRAAGNKQEQEELKKIFQISGGMMRGQIPIEDVQFFFNQKEIDDVVAKQPFFKNIAETKGFGTNTGGDFKGFVTKDFQNSMVQKKLNKLNIGGDRLKVDGIIGENSIKALKQFQKLEGMKQSGNSTPKLFKRILEKGVL